MNLKKINWLPASIKEIDSKTDALALMMIEKLLEKKDLTQEDRDNLEDAVKELRERIK